MRISLKAWWLLVLLSTHAAADFGLFSAPAFAAAIAAGVTIWNYAGFSCYWNKHMADDLDEYVTNNMYGQHIAAPLVRGLVRHHLESIFMENIDRVAGGAKALGIALHGNTGVGKTYLSNWIEKSLFRRSGHVHKFDGPFYTDPARVNEYRRNITDRIHNALKICDQSLFVFVDAHLFVDGLLDVLQPFLNAGAVDVNGVDYTKAIYIFQSNSCGKEINNEVVIQMKRNGVPREQITRQHMEGVLEGCLVKSDQTRVSYGTLLSSKVLHVVPFLPLEWSHVRMCINDQLAREREKGISLKKWRNLTWTDDFLDYLSDQLPSADYTFALHGCKDVPAQVSMSLLDIPRLNQVAAPEECMISKCYFHHAHDVALASDGQGHMVATISNKKRGTVVKATSADRADGHPAASVHSKQTQPTHGEDSSAPTRESTKPHGQTAGTQKPQRPEAKSDGSRDRSSDSTDTKIS